MQKNLWQIFWFIFTACFSGFALLLGAIINAPVIVPALVAIIFGAGSYYYFNKQLVTTALQDKESPNSVWYYVLLIAGVAIITNKSYYFSMQYGAWDAWTMWNYHALYLDHHNLKYIFQQTDLTQPGYPLLLPGIIAFFWQTLHTQSMMVPFAIAFSVTLMIPLIIYLNLFKKNIIVAGAVLFLLATDENYLKLGFWEYADLSLGMLFLSAIISAEYININKTYVVFTAAFLGLCMWTKNEGIMLAFILIIFNLRTLLGNGRWKSFIAGISLPLITVLVYKYLAPATDIIRDQNHKTLSHFLDWHRYTFIWEFMWNTINENFAYLKVGALVYAAICVAEKKLPGKNMLMLLCCLTGVFFVYVLTTRPLGWHMETSMSRVLFQLMPAFTYVIARQLCRLRFALPEKN